MDKYIGFDVDSKKTVACVIQKGKKDIYQALPTDPEALRPWLRKQRKGKAKLHLTFEVSGMSGTASCVFPAAVFLSPVTLPLGAAWGRVGGQ